MGLKAMVEIDIPTNLSAISLDRVHLTAAQVDESNFRVPKMDVPVYPTIA
jgi:hypothetical protein